MTSNDEMSPEEIMKIVKVASELGMKKVKLTGGEPLLRQEVPKIVSEIAHYVDEVSLTTNGVLLEKYARTLHNAGLKRVNVSLPSITPENFQKITGKPCVQQVKNGIEAALQIGLYPVKINVVVLKDINVDEIPKMVDFAEEVGATLQLIEFQPIPCENVAYWRNFYHDLAPIEDWLSSKATALEENLLHKRKRYVLKWNGGFVSVEIVRPMHNSRFCQNCTRLRVTSDGKLKPCLLRNDNLVDTVSLLRQGAKVSELKEAFKKAATLREPYWKEDEKMPTTNPSRQQPLRMVDIAEKLVVKRTAEAQGKIWLQEETIQKIRRGQVEKGDVLSAANVAGILAVKKTPELIPLCHPIPISQVTMTFQFAAGHIMAKCKVVGEYKTGVEMEALEGVSTALLTIWDMVKYLEKNENGQYPHTKIGEIRVLKKKKEPKT